MSEDIALRRRIAGELLGTALDDIGFAPCPGRYLHRGINARRDFQVCLEGAPTGSCFHASCADVVAEFNFQLRRRIGAAESGKALAPPVMGNVAKKPEPPRTSRRPPYDPAALADYAARCPCPVSEEWLVKRSPDPLPRMDAAGGDAAARFLSAIYAPGERVLVFTRQFTQGDFLFEIDRGGFRIGDRPGVEAVGSVLPDGGPEGVWFLTAPVTGGWRPNPNNIGPDGNVKLGRRHSACVTGWPFLVLESDEAPEDLWTRALVQLPLPIVAIYSSGGRSLHALVKVEAGSKAEFDAIRDDLAPLVCRLGADPAAMTAVRLSRLPGCYRHGKRGKDGMISRYGKPRLQRLLYLNPGATCRPILAGVPH